jgi:hypothetical protein
MSTEKTEPMKPRKRSAAQRTSDEKYKKEHREHAHEIYLAYYSRPEVKARMSAQTKAWYSLPEHREKLKLYIRSHPEAGKNWRRRNPVRAWASRSLIDHRSSGYIANITLEEVVALTKTSPSCFYCGVPLDFSPNKGVPKFNSPTIDRRDNQLEFSAESINLVCLRCNASKSDKTHEEYLLYLQEKHNKRTGLNAKKATPSN